MQRGEVVVITVGSLLTLLLLVALTSVFLQLCARQTYVLTQQLLPALTAAGFEYWMDWGTLLGARREGTMIPHDYDADIGMRESEVQRLVAAWDHEPRFKGMRLRKENDQLYRIRTKLGWVDVFRYQEGDDGTLRMISMANLNHSCQCPHKGHHIPRHIILPLTTLSFGGVTASAPAHVDAYLEHLYGSGWRTPRKNGVARLMTLMPGSCS
jgi:hypothetical protein